MEIDNEDKKYIKSILISSFRLKDRTADKFIQQLYEAFSCKCNIFFYNLKYSLHFKYNSRYSNKILEVCIKIFIYFISNPKYRYEKNELEQFFYNFLEIVFIDSIKYNKRIEHQRDTVQQVLQHTSKKLNNILKTQELMIANISHDMRTSLNAINGHLSLIDIDKIKDIKLKSNIEKALSSSSTLNSLVNDILDISKINAGELEIYEKYFWVDELIIEAINNINIDKKPIKLKVDIDLIAYRLLGDYKHILEIIINLLSNAIKYTDIGFIFLSVKIKKDSKKNIKIEFSIKDTGMGISKKDIETIFNPYTRINDDIQGVGLGLHISSKLLNTLGGELKVSSHIGEGSRFSFTLNFKKEKLKKKSIKSKKIYYFNDVDKDNIKILKKLGAKVKYFDDKIKFTTKLLSLKGKKPDIISIKTNREYYIDIDTLISHLKKDKKYKKSYFIADGVDSKIPLNNFDKMNEYITPISTYIKPKIAHKNSNKKSIHTEPIYILSVDDIRTNLELLKSFILKQYPNAIVDLANGGYEAIGMSKVREYDIIFIDLKMPGLNGFELLDRLDNIKDIGTIYALSADVYKSTYKKVEKSKFQGLLEKPFNIELIYNVVEKVIYEKNSNKDS